MLLRDMSPTSSAVKGPEFDFNINQPISVASSSFISQLLFDISATNHIIC